MVQMTKSLSKLLEEHDSMQVNDELDQTYLPSNEVKSTDIIPAGFDIPEELGQTTAELQDEVAPEFMRSCLKMANRAMSGQVNVFKDGDLPHKMVLLLAMKMIPNRKIGEKRAQETPLKNKQTARALKNLIESLTLEGEIVVDSSTINSGVEHPAKHQTKEREQSRAA